MNNMNIHSAPEKVENSILKMLCAMSYGQNADHGLGENSLLSSTF